MVNIVMSFELNKYETKFIGSVYVRNFIKLYLDRLIPTPHKRLLLMQVHWVLQHPNFQDDALYVFCHLGCWAMTYESYFHIKDFFILKGTVQRDFFTPVFSLNGLSWSQYTCIKAISNFVEFSWSSLYLKYQKVNSPLYVTVSVGSIDSPLKIITESQ
jgi:hypothetical protein